MDQHPSPFTAVADHVFRCTAGFAGPHGAESVNVGLVVGAEGAALIDCGATPEQGRLLRAAVAEVTDRPVTAVLLTHAHHDHSLGLAGVAAEVSVAHESVRDRLVEAGTPDPGLPSRGLAVAWALDLGGGVRVEAAHLGRGHTEGDLVIVVPGTDVVFAGDLIESAAPPSYGPDSFPHEWAATLDGLLGLMSDTTRAVPGHGDPVDREFVFEQRGRVAAVSGEISRLAGLGVTPEEAEARGNWALPYAYVRAGLEAGWVQARGAGPRRLPLA